MFSATEAIFLNNEAKSLLVLIGETQDSFVKYKAYKELWKRNYASGINYLYGEADESLFQESLSVLLDNYIAYLDFLQADKELNTRLIYSELVPLFSCFLLNSSEVTNKMSRFLPKSWNMNYEYEDDFYYSKFLFDFFKNGYSRTSESDIYLAQYSAACGGAEDARLSICKALLDKDAELFNDTMVDIHSQWQQFYADKRTRLALKDWCFLSEQSLFLEGLALLSLAKQANMPVNYEVADIPQFLL